MFGSNFCAVLEIEKKKRIVVGIGNLIVFFHFLFKDVIYKPYLARREEDNIRFANVLNQYRNHRILLRKKWKVQKNYLIGPRRAWKDR